MTMHAWRHVRVGGRDIATFSASAGGLTALSTHMDGSTSKRRLVRWCSPLIARYSQAELPANRQQRADAMVELGGRLAHSRQRVCVWIIMWPSGDRTQRQYAVGINTDGEPQVFLKGSTAQDDQNHFLTEHENLSFLQTTPLLRWRTPMSMGVEATPDMSVIATQCLPQDRRSLRLTEITARLPLMPSLPSKRVDLGAERLSWAELVERACGSDSFRKLLRQSRQDHFRTTLSHGDIQNSNAILAGGASWLVDWELATRGAPHGTDLVVAELKSQVWDWRRRVRSPLRPAQLASRCAPAGMDGCSVALAVAYRQQLGDHTARELAMGVWPDLESTRRKK